MNLVSQKQLLTGLILDMNKLNEKLSEVLDVEPIPVEEPEVLPAVFNSVEDDAEYARKNIRTLIEKGNLAVDGILHVAKASDHPRAYEVAAGLIKNLSELNKDLMDIQKKKQELNPQEKQQKNGISVDKAVFVGSTTELFKLLKNSK